MKRTIIAWLEGDLNGLFGKWTIPEGVKCDLRGDRKIILTFADNNIKEFYKLEQVIEQNRSQICIDLDSTFGAYDFTKEELKEADLLNLRFLGQSPIDIIEYKPITEILSKLQPNEKIEFYSFKKLKGQIVLTSSNWLLFHNSLINDIKREGLGESLRTIPCSIKVKNRMVDENWMWMTSNLDLGKPFFEKRFVFAFERGKWKGADFCISTFLGCHIIFISQRVFKFLDSLPKEQKRNLIFEPVELL